LGSAHQNLEACTAFLTKIRVGKGFENVPGLAGSGTGILELASEQEVVRKDVNRGACAIVPVLSIISGPA